MEKYKITTTYTSYDVYIVSAESAEEAKELLEDTYFGDEYYVRKGNEGDGFYAHEKIISVEEIKGEEEDNV